MERRAAGEKQYGPASRWMIRHVFTAPGGWSRFSGMVLFGAGVILLVLTVILFADPSSSQDDRDFFPFITVFFFFLSALFFVAWFVFWIIDRLRR
ncbi:hypothetical protein J2Y69_002943 [Microbacterium resistens]|uniref:Uncharacterized protein n=1 Tax=Microbacterium resistens TaxID=156977 RepID=A0ABU1SFG0_9MICO|nr:hypothetical protein [Microbacterium resistens]MDR6868329.1 hypothetical protein [Microbacterium resistens]